MQSRLIRLIEVFLEWYSVVSVRQIFVSKRTHHTHRQSIF